MFSKRSIFSLILSLSLSFWFLGMEIFDKPYPLLGLVFFFIPVVLVAWMFIYSCIGLINYFQEPNLSLIKIIDVLMLIILPSSFLPIISHFLLEYTIIDLWFIYLSFVSVIISGGYLLIRKKTKYPHS